MDDLSFDDLIPKKPGGAGLDDLSFDDLIPAVPQDAPSMPAEPPAPGALTVPQGRDLPPDLPLGELLKDALPATPGLNSNDPFLTAVQQSVAPARGERVMPPAPDTSIAPGRSAAPSPPDTDPSTALGDLTAGWLQLRQIAPDILPGGDVGVAGALGDLVRMPQQAAALDPQIAELDAQAASLEADIGLLTGEDQAFALEQLAQLRERANQLRLLQGTPTMTGYNAATDMAAALPEALGLQAEIDQIPMNPAAEAVGQAGSFGEGLSAAMADPIGVMRTFFLRSLPVSAPTIAGAAIGSLGGPAGAAAGAGAGSFMTEGPSAVMGEVLNAVRAAGIDPADPEAVRTLVQSDPEFFAKVMTDAAVRAGVISAADAATAGLTGRLISAFAPAAPVKRAAVGAAAGGVVDPAGGAAGEAGAQLATEGQVTAPGDVIAEAAGGVGGGAVQGTGQAIMQAVTAKPPALAPKITPADEPAEQPMEVPKSVQPPAPQEAPVMPAPEPETVPPVATEPAPAAPAVGEPKVTPPPEARADAEQAAQAGEPGAAPAGSTDAAPEQAPRKAIVYTADNEPVEVETQVVEADDLVTSDMQDYPAELQPRDRSRAASQAQIEGIANNPIPARLDQSPEVDRGAPIIGSDGRIVESGNGRVMGLRRAYERGTAEEYRAYVLANYPEAAGMRNPVIIRRRVTEVDTPAFASVANQSATLQMSAVERAKDDARYMNDDVIALYKGGDVAGVSNREMIRAFIARLPQAAQGALVTKEGGLSIEGQRRFQSALFTRAYSSDTMLTRLAETPDDDMASLTNAMLNAAPRVAQLRAEIRNGRVAPEVGELIPSLNEAAAIIADFRKRGMDLKGYRSQIDAFAEPVSELADTILSAFYNPAGTKMVSKKAMQDFLQDFVTEAMKERIDQAQMPGIEPRPRKSPEEIANAVAQRPEPAETGSLFEVDGSGRPRADQRGKEERRARDGEGRAQGAGSLLDATPRDNTGRRPRGRLTPGFLKFSFSNRISVFNAAFKDAGIDPTEAKLMDADAQIRTISKMLKERFAVTVVMPEVKVTRKNLTGRKVTETRRTITTREALDQLLDAYRQMHMMASVLGVPEHAIGLEIDGKGIELALVGAKRLGALGMFSWSEGGQRRITLPGRSNSFAHEWGHALDHFLTQNIHRPWLKGMLTRSMDTSGVQPLANPRYLLTEAFSHLMWAMYGDAAQVKTLIQTLQVKASQIGPDGQLTAEAKAAQRQLNDMKEGKRPPDAVLSQYFKTSRDFDQAVGSGGYFVDAAEMFARAFEAWVGHTVAKVSDLPQSFLSKGDWAYSLMEDPRLAMTFPKGADLEQFQVAMTRLSHAMSVTNLFGVGPKAQLPADTDIFDPTQFLQRPKKIGLAQREGEALREVWSNVKGFTSPKAWGEALHGFGRGGRGVYQEFLNTGAAAMFAVAGRQQTAEARDALTRIATMVATRPGQGKLTKPVYQREMEMRALTRLNKIEGAVRRRFGEKRLTEAQVDQLNQLLRGGKPRGADTKIVGLAADMRTILDEIWYDLRDAGIEVGYEKGYLPHIYDTEKVMADRAGFRAAAEEVYGLWFRRDIIEADDPETQIKDINAVIRELRGALRSMPDGTKEPEPRLTEADEEAIDAWRSLRSKISAMQNRLKTAKDPDKLQDQINEAMAELDEMQAALLEDILLPAWSRLKAEQWDVQIAVGQLNDFASFGPTTQFTKKRVLPREAGLLMRDYMQDDPIGLVSGYAFAAARRAEWAKRFGPADEKLETMLQAASRAGVNADDIDFFKQGLNAAGGRFDDTKGWRMLRTAFFAYGNIRLLGLATFASLAEPAVTGLRTGYARDSFYAMTAQMRALASRGRREDLKETARAIGLIAPYAMDQLVHNRMSADAAGTSERSQRLVQRFFQINGLTPLTSFQRVALLPVAHHAIERMLREDVTGKRSVNSMVRDVIGGGKGSFVDGELNELGIAKADRKDLLDWLDGLGRMPGMHDLYYATGEFHPAAGLWARAVNVMVNETIQNPIKTDRAIAANQPHFAHLYGIMSFIDAFSRNIIERSIRRGFKKDDGTIERGAKLAGNLTMTLAPFAALYAAQFAATALREFLMNQDKWDEHEEDEDLIEWLLQLTFERSIGFGRLTPFYSMWSGVRYERDLTSVTAGPYITAPLQDVMTIMRTFAGRNSPNTNTAENNAAMAFYQLAIMPTLAMLISGLAPTGPFTGLLSRGILLQNADKDNAKAFANTLTGDKGTKYQGDPPWFEVGKKEQEE